MAAVASALLASLWQGAALAGAAWLGLTLLGQRSAALRHGVGMAFLLAITIAPIVTFVHSLAAPVPEGSGAGLNGTALLPPALLAWLWSAGVAWKLVRLVSGWRAFRRLETHRFERLPPEWLDRVERLRQRLGIARPVAVRLVAGVLPCSARLLRPVIWLPATLLIRMAPDQIEAILAHELAHVRRLDWLWNALQCVVEALFFYHPGIWWLSRRIRQERENACDDLAVRACGDPITLAEALSALETIRRPIFVLSSQGGSLMKRVSRLLTPGARPTLGWKVPLAAIVLTGVGAALALQSGSASATGDTAPRWWQLRGDAVQLNRNVGSERRGYMRWRDGNGQVRERYVVNGHARPIDAATRQWIAETSVVPPPPSIPAPPAPPSMTDDPAYQAAIAALHTDPGVRAALGIPATVRLAGPSRISPDAAELSLTVTGTKGVLRLQAIRETRGAAWRFEHVPTAGNR